MSWYFRNEHLLNDRVSNIFCTHIHILYTHTVNIYLELLTIQIIPFSNPYFLKYTKVIDWLILIDEISFEKSKQWVIKCLASKHILCLFFPSRSLKRNCISTNFLLITRRNKKANESIKNSIQPIKGRWLKNFYIYNTSHLTSIPTTKKMREKRYNI